MIQDGGTGPGSEHQLRTLAPESLHALLASITDNAVGLLDLAGSFTAWSPAAERDFGHSAEQVIGQPMTILHPTDQTSVAHASKLLRLALEEGQVRETARRIRRDGRSLLVDARLTTLHDVEGRPIGFVLTMRRLEAGVESGVAAEARYRALFEHAPIGIVHADADSFYIDANASACAMLGYAHDELVGLHATDIVEPTEAENVNKAIDDALAPGGHRRSWRFRRKDGTSLIADVVALAMPDGTLLGLLHDRTDQEEARRHRDHLAAIVESSSDAIVGEDLEGRITSWNSAAATLFGYSAAEMLGAHITRLLPPGQAREETLSLERSRDREPAKPLETQRKTRDGRLIDVSITTSPISDSAGRLIGASRSARDITQAKARERELARVTRLYAALSQVNQAIVLIKDRQALFDRICEILVQAGGFRMAWIGWEELGTKCLAPIAAHGDEGGYLIGLETATDERPQGLGPAGIAFRSGKSYICNDMLTDPATLLRRARRSELGFRSSVATPIREDGQVRGVLNVYADRPDVFHDQEIALLEEAASDLSFALDNLARDEDRRLIEERLRNEKLFSDTIIEALPVAVYLYDQHGRFLRWNRNFEQITGYSHCEIAMMAPLDFFPENQRPVVQARISDVFTSGESYVEASLKARDGTLRPHLLTGRRVEFQGQPCLVGAGLDLNERELRHRAEAADQIKSAFLATMSHELRTPLNSIIGFTGILLQGLAGSLNAEQSKQLGMVRGSARHLLALVNDVLDISKIEAGQLEIGFDRFDPVAVIQRTVEGVLPQATAKGLTLRATVPDVLGTMRSDERRFAQILLNLLSNAIKFTETGGIEVDAWLTEAEPPMLCVAVTDSGIGISGEDISTLFQPFRQIGTGLARRSEGTGLGLAICRRLAILMGGDVEVKSKPGAGSIFTVKLPLEAPVP